MLPIKFPVNWPFGSGEKAMAALLNFRSDRFFVATNYPDASYQVSNQFAQGCRRSRLLKQIVDDARRATDDARRTLTDHNSTSCSEELRRYGLNGLK